MHIAVIPCRKNSKGIPGKNFRIIGGKPLWGWTVEAARDSNVFDKIILSSDGGLLMDWEDDQTWMDNNRPAEYSTDDAQLEPLLLYYAKKFDADVITLLQPTSPLRSSSDITKAYYIFMEGDIDCVVSVTPVGDKYWMKIPTDTIPLYNPEHRLNRQDPKTDLLFYENGAIYITKRWLLEDNNSRIGGKVGFYKMSQRNSHQIDSEDDWKVAECLLS